MCYTNGSKSCQCQEKTSSISKGKQQMIQKLFRHVSLMHFLFVLLLMVVRTCLEYVQLNRKHRLFLEKQFQFIQWAFPPLFKSQSFVLAFNQPFSFTLQLRLTESKTRALSLQISFLLLQREFFFVQCIFSFDRVRPISQRPQLLFCQQHIQSSFEYNLPSAFSSNIVHHSSHVSLNGV